MTAGSRALAGVLVAIPLFALPVGPLRGEPTAARGAPADTLADVRVAVVSEAGGALEGLVAEARAGERSPGTTVRWTKDGREALVTTSAAPGVLVVVRVRAPGHLPDSVVARAGGEAEAAARLVLRLDPLELPPIEAAVRWREVSAGASRSVSQVRFAESPVTWTNLGEWLATLPGLSVRSGVAAGGQVVSVRGSRPEGVLVLLDGIPVNDPMTGSADLSGISVASLESATLVRGAGSAWHGSGALAGVLLLRSRRAEGTAASGAVRLGSHGALAAEAFGSVSGGTGRAALSLAAGRAENDFRYEDRTAPGDPAVTRRNADGSHLSAALAAARGDLRLDVRYDGLERGTPGPMGTALHDGARWREERVIGALSWHGDAATTALRLGRRGTRWDPGDRGPASDTDGLDLAAGAELRIPSAAGLLLAARLRGESLSGDALARDASRLTAGLSAAARLEAGATTFEPALAVDAGGGRAVLSPELGVRVPLSSRLAVRGRVGQAFRHPTFGDLYFASSYRVQANPDLWPERVLLDAEVGLDGAWEGPTGRLEAGAAAWHRVTEDPIVWLASSVAVWSPRNLDRLVSSGAELRLDASTGAEPSAGWRGWGSVTIDRSRLGFGANRNPMPYRPGTSAALGLERRSRAWAARSELHWTGPRTTSVAATRELPGFVLVDLAVARRIVSGGVPLEAELRVRNVFDRRYELVELHPEPGRSVALTLRAR